MTPGRRPPRHRQRDVRGMAGDPGVLRQPASPGGTTCSSCRTSSGQRHGLALHYVMSATVKDPSIYGAEHVGKKWSVEVMSFLRFDGDRVCFEADFHDKGSRARSLGITVSVGATSVRRCSGSSSWSPGVNCQRPRADPAAEPPPVRRVGRRRRRSRRRTSAAGSCVGPRVRARRTCSSPRTSPSSLEHDDVGDVVGRRVVGLAEVLADLLDRRRTPAAPARPCSRARRRRSNSSSKRSHSPASTMWP